MLLPLVKSGKSDKQKRQSTTNLKVDLITMHHTDPVFLLRELIRCRSVTPDEGGALSFLQQTVEAIGFTVERPVFCDHATPDIENLYAKYGDKGPHLMFAGHTDVVPAGDESQWSYPAFAAQIADGAVYGRGAVDMKGSIACFIAALARCMQKKMVRGTVSLLITGDEEGPAINGTAKLLPWAAAKGESWDAALVGEPTCPEILGDTIKIGRRGSLSALLRIRGRQGHVAYPQLADNPLPNLLALLAPLVNQPLDKGTEHFQPSNLELTSIDSANKAGNVIPAKAEARFNIRFNDLWSPQTLMAEIEKRLHLAEKTIRSRRCDGQAVDYTVSWLPNPGRPFLTHDNPIIRILTDAIGAVTGRKPQLSTSGGTSDARFIKDYCPVIEFGLVGKTMHKTDECASLTDLEQLTAIYQHFIENFFAI